MRIEIIDSLNKISQVEETYFFFEKNKSIPLGLKLNHLRRWWEYLGEYNNHKIGINKKLFFFIGYKKNDEPYFILPLMRITQIKKKILKLNKIEFFSQTFGGPVMDIIHCDLSPEDIIYIFNYIKKNIKSYYIELAYIPENSILINSFPDNFYLHSASMYIPLDSDYESIRKNIYSKNLRHVLNKFNRRIAEFPGNIKNKIIQNKEEILAYKDKIMNVSLSKINSKGMHSVYENQKIGEYYFSNLILKSNCFCSIYELNDDLLAYNMGFINKDTVYAIDAAFNRNFSDSQKIGFGILAYDQIVREFAGKFKKLDMGHGIDDYKFRFTKKFIPTYYLLLKGNQFLTLFWYSYTKKQLIKREKNLKNSLISY